MQPECSAGMAPSWVQTTMAALPTGVVTDVERSGFYNAAVAMDRKRLQHAVDDLSDVCR